MKTLPVAQVVPNTAAEGPGRRFALWLQGCPLRCPGCCNPEMLPFTGGTPTPIDDLMTRIEQAARDDSPIEGITLLGGEPFAHADGADELAGRVQSRGLSVMVFSGYTIEELRADGTENPPVARLLAHTDLLVDGPYLREQPDTLRRWIGSRNQRIHFLSDRYREDDPRWSEPDTLELRLENGELTVNGFPARSAVGIWKRIRSGSSGEG
jgi:anaerobic ribonucleoside-triphosphate reductase activating protein